MSALPEGWTTRRLGQLTSKIGSGSTPKGGSEVYHSHGVPLIRSMNVHFGGFKSDGLVYLDESQADKLKAVEVCENDVLLNITGASIGRVTLAPREMVGARVNQHVSIIRLLDGIDPRYVRHYLASPVMQELIVETESGVTRQALTKGKIEEFEIPLPPLAEQKRIADKLDALLARVDACRARLARVPAVIKRFRQAVLDAAVSGRLTEDWREENEIAFPWNIVALPDVAQSRLGKMLDKAKNQGTLTPYLRNINVRWFDFDLTDIQEIRILPAEAESLFVRNGDVLVCEGGEPGRCAVWRGENNTYVFQKALHRVQVNDKLLPDWLCYCLKAEADSGRLEDLFTGTTIKHLTGVAFARFELGLPPLLEQHEIVRRVETLFAYADQLDARLAAARTRVEQLTPSLLAKAFRGELVKTTADAESNG